jgi:L-lactate dehydrogenase complex protein LldE
MIVDLFIPCYIDQTFPETANNMVRVLEKLGCGINYNVEQTCCGRTAFVDGYHKECKMVGEKLIREFQNDRFIVCPSSLCTGMIKTQYPELFHNSALHNEYKNVQKHIYEFSDFLVNVLNVTDVGARLEGTATFHDSCKALRELNIKQAPRTLLSKVRGLTLIEMPNGEECCGFDTSFSDKFENISADIGQRKVNTIESTKADYIISTDYSCLMHMNGIAQKNGISAKFVHLADVLASGW